MYLEIKKLEITGDEELHDVIVEMAKARNVTFRQMVSLMAAACQDFLLNEYLEDDLIDNFLPDLDDQPGCEDSDLSTYPDVRW